ncbi:Por secretion system C-terminal sorting domain-containing protein [Hymenobacter psychrotolerans DSM 18569]|uniref:Por secretion system C-terminal sorting domain-containing protein n=2 Tax=Hymenobacter psychrotolerans TaxID=344998 RepID=A0A1M6VCX9_9BACT|nr:Por secretion system C-terminal sorting domain-containing protein [Hymenobacter psychrotolerans DSM 18569]
MPVLRAQVVSTQPLFFQDTTPITLTFDATQGNAALAGFTGPVYIWTGVITNLSTSNSDWKHVKSPSFTAPDPAALLTRSATNPNQYSISFTPRTFYNVPAGEQILKLAMVFRNANGTIVGRASGGGDIFVDVQQSAALTVRITSPVVPAGGNPLFLSLNDQLSVTGTASASTSMALYLNNVLVTQQASTTALSGTVTATQAGRNVVKLVAGTGAQQVADSLVFVVRPAVNVAALPAGAKDGVTYLNGGTSVLLNLTAPGKQFVYALGEWNNWQVENAAYMNKTPDGNRWWLQINGLTPGVEYAYQYLVDGTLRIADPYTEKVLDPSNDSFIPAATYPNLKPYPTGRTTGIVSVLQTGQTAYQWQVTNFQKPKKTDLVIYELLVRDFIERHDYETLRDTLNYLQRLGVNAIELMPFNEFEGNESWGYNPSFYFAPDKYYGTKNELKRFIDECHRRGIAVLMDMVLNHSCGQSPMVQLYFDGNAGKPAANSPWFNQDATHPFNVCYDFNHESPFTQYFVEKVNAHWLQEYKIDGYRFDLSKGFTQRVSAQPGLTFDQQSALMGQYDQSRINTWTRIYGQLTAIDPNVFCILEHFAENSEEKVLADAGMMLWGNMTHNYNEATMGYVGSSDLSYGYYGARTWNQPNLVTYMESHDEERLMVKNLAYGNQANPAHNPRNLATALARNEAAAAFFFLVPGPKMVWQFGEVGYDVSIDFNGRTGNKPIRWTYYDEQPRRQLYDAYRYLIGLKKADPVFETGTFTQNVTGATKTLHLSSSAQNITVVGNFDVTAQSVNPAFQRTGKWYNYLSGDSITVTSATAPLTLQPGQYAVYTTSRVKKASVLSARPRATQALRLTASPNPTATTATLRYELPSAAPVTVTVLNLLGATVRTVEASTKQPAGAHQLQLPVQDLANGVYIVQLSTGQLLQTTRLVVQH